MHGSQARSVGLVVAKSPAAYRENITNFIWKVLNSGKCGMRDTISVT